MKLRIHVILISIVLILSAGHALAQNNVISTVAGTGTAGYSGDGGPATSAQLNAPFGIAADSAGNIYIAEWSNHRVRKVSASGVITTFAGIGVPGFGGDGGPATQAALNSPEGVAVDAAGNVYIADSFNNRIRKIDTSGVITTIAGNGIPRYNGEGAAIEAGLNDPSGVVTDNNGNLYIADNSSHRIRKVVLAAGTISTIAGTGVGGFSGDGGPAVAAQLYNPTHLAIDSAGNIYIADYTNNRVREINGSTGIITTVAGSATPQEQGAYSGDGGPATSAQFNKVSGVSIDTAGNLYIVDAQNKRVRKVNASTGIVTTIAGGGANGDGCNSDTAALRYPLDVAASPSGSNLYIDDYSDNRIRMISTTENASLPTLTSISPSNGIPGRAYQVTLTGTGFVVSGGGASCSNGVTTVGITGSGVTTGDVSIANGTITVTFTVAPDAPPQSHDVTVANSRGASNPLKFNVGLATPTITSISPSSGLRGTTVTVTLTGTNFVSNSGPTTVQVGPGNKIGISNVNVKSDTSLTATFNIFTDATVGNYSVFVSTPRGGQSNAIEFDVKSSTPVLTSISPSSGVRGTSIQVTLSGKNFAATSPTVKISSAGITVTNTAVVSDTSLTATFTIAPTATLGNYYVFISTAAGGDSSNVTFAVNPKGPTITYGLPQLLNPTQQAPMKLTMDSALPDEVTGQVALTFTSNATNNPDDPNVTFVGAESSDRTIGFRFAPSATTADFSLTNTVLQAGTVAGTIRLTLTDVKVGGQPVTPSNSTFDVTIPLLPPVITNVRLLNRSSAGFQVEVTGYSTSREITQATFQFAAASGGNLITTQLQPDVVSTFATYYQSPASMSVGSAFVYLQPFITEQGDANVVTSVTVTLTNSQGTSDPKTAP
jgi:hypothetical protein